MKKNIFIYTPIYRGRAGMFVANHNSWMDIPFMGITVGWRNYKLISKAELGKVPILGKAIALGGHVMVDRSDRKSQLKTLKLGMQWLKVSESEYNSNITVCYSISMCIVRKLMSCDEL
jgi:1-acyl-sn-glycerol-3-phosphate acyltransferase